MLQVGVGQDQAEFVAAIAAGQIVLAQAEFELIAELTQYAVAHHMSVSIVNGFEVIDIDKRDHRLAMLLLAGLELELQQVFP
ncbi:hypothetical protein D3C81_1092020 [compost metagenome]